MSGVKEEPQASPPLRPASQPLRSVRSFSTNSRPALRAAGGRPRPGNDTTVTGMPVSPSTQVVRARPPEEGRPVSDSCRTVRRLEAQPLGRIDVVLRAIPATGTLVIEPALDRLTTPRAPHPPKRRPDPVQHVRLPLCPRTPH